MRVDLVKLLVCECGEHNPLAAERMRPFDMLMNSICNIHIYIYVIYIVYVIYIYIYYVIYIAFLEIKWHVIGISIAQCLNSL